MSRQLRSIHDLSDGDIVGILRRASALQARGYATWSKDEPTRILGLVFMQPSLRTRVGFEVAAARLGWRSVSVFEQRASQSSTAESVDDTLRVVSGMVDAIVARLAGPISAIATDPPVPLINGGDVGPMAEHPTQALIDLFSIEQELGPIGGLRIAICGDLRLRTSRSLLRLFERHTPARLSLITVPELTDRHHVSAIAVDSRTLGDLSDIDVLYVAGIPHRAVPEHVRDTLRVSDTVLSRMPPNAIVLSPLPVIDEIDHEARRNSRLRMFEQSDRGVSVRAAILEHLTG